MRTLVWYHPEFNFIVLRWKYKYICCWEGIDSDTLEGKRWLNKAMWRPSRYGFIKLGKFE